jgi:DNA polymerase-3 subunit gamma/tau
MTYQVLARKWRPRKFQEVIGQDHITTTLKNSILKEKIAHAYLFTGTRGVGKTTVARIFAKAIRCENLDEQASPCLKCESCLSVDNSSSLDYIEIDGASNTGVDNIRELIDNVQYLPTTGSKKVYVIDEVHMLSVSAFNALLKTLEEPPEHVVFIFATTDPQKLLGTVISRCQRFDFKHVDVATLSAHIKNIATKENIDFENELVVNQIAKFGEGSVRDTLSLLDQVLSLSIENKITEDSLLLSLGLAKTSSLKNILEALFECDKTKVIKNFNHILNENIDIKKFSKQILDTIFNIIEDINLDGQTSFDLIDDSIIEKLSVSEILWIYEVLLKDFKWSFENLNPEKMVLFSLIKISLRSEVLGIKGTKLSVKKKTDLTDAPIEPIAVKAPVVVEEIKKEVEVKTESKEEIKVEKEDIVQKEVEAVKEEIPKVKNWDNLLDFIFKSHKAIGSNLEHGNITKSIVQNSDSVNINIGFNIEDKIFYDYLSGQDIKTKLKNIIKEFYEDDLKIDLNLTMVKVENTEFKSKAQIKVLKDEEIKEDKIQRMKSNKYILEAQSLFGQEIESIKVND